MLLEDLRVVLRVAEFRSITAAATNLDMRTATASAAVKRVEANLGAELFVRTTRSLRISSAGERYLPQCEQALQLLERAKLNMRDDLDIIDGEVRIAVSSDLGRNQALTWLDEFVDAYPSVTLRTDVSDSKIDFYRDSVDMALRYGSPKDSNLYGFKICSIPRLVCASPSYLKQHGTPNEPSDLLAHNGLFYQFGDMLYDEWTFPSESGDYKVKLKGNRASNDSDVVRRWCVAGKGYAIKSSLDVADDLMQGRVVSILTKHQPEPIELWLICPSRQSITPAVRKIRDIFRSKTEQILATLKEKGLLG
ncbi:LysR substrate-binding domain-containing protein [Vibrio profundum]|uniref:LysR family transcriptional regulator n=1 Tax=Vibrio profundum TaxID=2910247 RepID=UPI003D0B6E22